MEAPHKFAHSWKLADGFPAPGITANGLKVFGTFICGGGSSMGYKLAGYTHLGGVEIDPAVSAIYSSNLHPQLLYTQDLREFNKRDDLPAELYSLDILDGSPPCSTFSMAGSRENAWGKQKKFAEGQALQTLDDLVFVYCDTIKKLRPKTFILENVSGLVKGNAKSYLKRIYDTMKAASYTCQVFLLNAASMGVPQKRERTFVIGHKSELPFKPLALRFNEPPIYFSEIIDRTDTARTLTDFEYELFKNFRPDDKNLAETNRRVNGKNSGYTRTIASSYRVLNTLTTTPPLCMEFPRYLNYSELCKGSTFPLDYEAPNTTRLQWLVGMSVPPVMMAQIAHQMYLQWFQV